MGFLPASVKPKTTIAKGKCLTCGRDVAIKANKNGTAYYYCSWPCRTSETDQCNDHHRYGATISRQLLRAYLATKSRPETIREANEHDQRNQPANLPNKPIAEPGTREFASVPNRPAGDDQRKRDGWDLFQEYGGE